MAEAKSGITYLDLDKVEAPEVVIRLDGVEHQLKQITLSDWIANTKEVQNLVAASGDLEVESNVIIAMIARSFPTLEKEVLMNMPLIKLNKILAYANGNNGTNDVAREVEAQTAVNPLSAAIATAAAPSAA